jgi:hypothetical protein
MYAQLRVFFIKHIIIFISFQRTIAATIDLICHQPALLGTYSYIRYQRILRYQRKKQTLSLYNVLKRTSFGESLSNAGAIPEPVVTDVLWGKVATKVGSFLAKSMNLVHTFPHGPQIVKL